MLVDQFAAPSMVNDRLEKAGFKTPITHRTKAESDRRCICEYHRPRHISEITSDPQPKVRSNIGTGRGQRVLDAGRALVKAHGQAVLGEVAGFI